MEVLFCLYFLSEWRRSSSERESLGRDNGDLRGSVERRQGVNDDVWQSWKVDGLGNFRIIAGQPPKSLQAFCMPSIEHAKHVKLRDKGKRSRPCPQKSHSLR